MTYQAVLQYLHTLPRYPATAGLQRIEQLLAASGCNYQALRFVHVTGTNGKGSTCAMLARVLQQAGYRTGLFTSPHLLHYNERIKINGIDISEADFLAYFEHFQPLVQAVQPCIFEVLWAMALQYYVDQQVDTVVVEVGIGGRYDPTNIITSAVSVITNVDLDHTEILGKTKAAIAQEKAGIIKSNSICITTERDPAMIEVFETSAAKQHAQLIVVQPSDTIAGPVTMTGQEFSYQHYSAIKLSLLGEHQLTNAAGVIAAIAALRQRGWDISDAALYDGLATVRWPLRFEVLQANPLLIADVGHNPAGLQAVSRLVSTVLPHYKKIIIFGCSYDKPYQAMADIICPLADELIITQAQYKAVPVDQLFQYVTHLPSSARQTISQPAGVAQAIVQAEQLANTTTVILILGGLYLAAEAKQYLTQRQGIC
ncbi:MAG: bifunctional folylpolyglutamate synthase/dihydrofolate synthase [Candidatus Kerfeldbacteria bacterium]|nr:bifunctional folylpolyglutamate synthase/dihydrofolate synthase [Candidatus Kerfeldbacteria bacterium]